MAGALKPPVKRPLHHPHSQPNLAARAVEALDDDAAVVRDYPAVQAASVCLNAKDYGQ
jgi:hypothetical protein